MKTLNINIDKIVLKDPYQHTVHKMYFFTT